MTAVQNDRPRGVFAAALTPLDDDLSPDIGATLGHYRWLLQEGCDGIVCLGTTGEANSFSLDERLALLDALGATELPAKLVVGTGCCAVADTVRLSKKALEIGAAGVLVLPPFYYKGVSDDGLYGAYAETIERVHDACPDTSVEALVGDFRGDSDALARLIDARPQILAHNLETVRRMHSTVRPQARYERSLAVLKQIKDGGLMSKTSIMVGIGEHDQEILQLMDDVRSLAGTDILTIGQYLQPTRNHLPIDRWVTPEQFDQYRVEGLARGFGVVESGPLVRSSYHADEQAELAMRC